jgi:hypothetical protein
MSNRRGFVKTNAPGYEKNMTTNVVINSDNNKYKTFIKARERSKRMKDLEYTVKKQSSEISELREMVLKLLEKE